MFEIVVAGLLVLFAASSSQVSSEDLFVPALSFLLVLLPLPVLAWRERRVLLEGVDGFTKPQFPIALLGTALALYVTPLFGFSIISSLLTLFYIFVLGERRIVPIMLLLVVWNAVYFGVFVELLHVPIPTGEIFSGLEG